MTDIPGLIEIRLAAAACTTRGTGCTVHAEDRFALATRGYDRRG